MIEYNETYNSVVTEFQLNSSGLKQIEQAVESLTKARMDICKLLKITDFTAETLDANEKQFIISIDENISIIKECEKKQIELKAQIKVKKQEIKAIKLHINKLEHKIWQEKLEGRKIREALRIFLSREKFKIIKKLLIRRYRKVFLKYSSVVSIKTNIVECNGRKEKMQREKQSYTTTINSNNKKIIFDKKALAEMREIILNMQKSNNISIINLQYLEDYKKTETKFRLEVQNCE
jgi:hypothetical protein